MPYKLSSMTGFGRAIVEASFGKLVVEIQSTNRKHLEVVVFLPKELGRFEPDVRRWIGKDVSRGQVQVRIYVHPNAESVVRSLPDPEVLRGFKEGWEKIATQAGLKKEDVNLSFLMLHSFLQQKSAFSEDGDRDPLELCVHAAVKDWILMREKEGSALASDLKHRLVLLRQHLHTIQALAPEAALKMREQLLRKMEEFLEKNDSDFSERIAREAALYAEKWDIAEEIIRLLAHFGQFEEILHSSNIAVGRKMDFLIQEIGREINTIGSKSAEVKISHLVVEMKSELERMREQAQNIE